MPCGIPSNFTYSSLSSRYFIGVAINNKIYEIPSNTAISLKIFFNVKSTIQTSVFLKLKIMSWSTAIFKPHSLKIYEKLNIQIVADKKITKIIPVPQYSAGYWVYLGAISIASAIKS